MQLLISLLISIAFGYQAKQKGRDGLKFGAGIATALLVPLAAIQFWDQAVGADPALWWVVAAFVTYMAWTRLQKGPSSAASKWETSSHPDSHPTATPPSAQDQKIPAKRFSLVEKLGIAFFSVILIVGLFALYGPRAKQAATSAAVEKSPAAISTETTNDSAAATPATSSAVEPTKGNQAQSEALRKLDSFNEAQAAMNGFYEAVEVVRQHPNRLCRSMADNLNERYTRIFNDALLELERLDKLEAMQSVDLSRSKAALIAKIKARAEGAITNFGPQCRP